MKRKYIVTFLAITTAGCCVLGLGACDKNDNSELTPTEGLVYELLEDENSYAVIGIGTATDESIVFPTKYNDKPVTYIAFGAFYGCTNLTSITIPDSVTVIADGAFSSCTSLTNITLPDSIIHISSSAFYDSAYYNDESNWENGVLYIGKHLIAAKNEISGNYDIKPGTLTIASLAFNSCKDLTSITIPNSVTDISSAFYDCTSLTSITIPDSVTSIGNWTFDGCTSLTSITIPNSITSIGNGAFSDCTSLTSVIIGSGVTSICDYAFMKCENLTDVYYKGSEEDWSAINIGNNYYYFDSVNIHYNYNG